jgi:general secretion pathway protein L
MKYFHAITIIFWVWIDSISQTVSAFAERFRTTREIQLIENDDDSLTLRMIGGAEDAGLADYRLESADAPGIEALPADWRAAVQSSQFQFVLRSSRFLLRPLELPRRAGEFLDGIIRSQIDRLTPWLANDAVYGWTPPVEISQDRLHLQVVATARTITVPYIQLAERLGAQVVSIATSVVGADSVPTVVKVFELRSQSTIELLRVRRVVSGLFLVVGAIAAILLSASIVVGDMLDSQRLEISQKIAERRVAMNVSQDNSGSPESLLVRRKRETSSSVIMLEALSQILPDHTYLTELRLETDKLQLIGISRDAPSLVKLIEQSPQFSRATFFAPTTRSAGVEHFHIEARLKPYFEVGL